MSIKILKQQANLSQQYIVNLKLIHENEISNFVNDSSFCMFCKTESGAFKKKILTQS